ncbi:hypothetical protein FRC02_005130 [Tulasnella sp. 418]|nr:hypothetical protein FRC02_005130 [Tulasnella sp. 418]
MESSSSSTHHVNDLEKQQDSASTPRMSIADDNTMVHVDSGDALDQVVSPDEPREETEKDLHSMYLVKWDGPDDPENPKNWSKLKRWYLTMASGLLVLNATFSSSAPAGILGQLVQEFQLSHIEAVLTISLFVAGYCIGPLLWGPLSEQYGRKPVLLIGFFVYTLFQMGNALAQNKETVLVMRFLGGTFAASPLTTSGGIIADIWDADIRGKALAFFTLAPFAGPAIGPIVGGVSSCHISAIPGLTCILLVHQRRWRKLEMVILGLDHFRWPLLLLDFVHHARNIRTCYSSTKGHTKTKTNW